MSRRSAVVWAGSRPPSVSGQSVTTRAQKPWQDPSSMPTCLWKGQFHTHQHISDLFLNQKRNPCHSLSSTFCQTPCGQIVWRKVIVCFYQYWLYCMLSALVENDAGSTSKQLILNEYAWLMPKMEVVIPKWFVLLLLIHFEWSYFAETIVWTHRQTSSPNRRSWGTAAPAAAWMKPAVAAALSALKVPAVVRAHVPPPAAACSMTTTAARRPPGQRNPPPHGARRAEESFGKEPAAAAAAKGTRK